MCDFLKKIFHIPKFAKHGIIEKPIIPVDVEPPEFVVNMDRLVEVLNYLEEKRMEDKNVLIYADDARREILREAPQLAYIIDRIKPADAVELVLCKDCKHYDKESFWCEMNGNDRSKWFSWYEDDFCSYGEREDNERKTD